MRLADLIRDLPIRIIAGADGAPAPSPSLLADPSGVRICDITEDSRTALPGSLFIARRGEKSDGRRFIKAAIEAGAVAVLVDDDTVAIPGLHHGHPPVVVLHADDIQLASAQLAERFFGNPSSKLTLIGVTGTKGKTTTTFLIHQMLNALGVRAGLIGTVCIDDGVETAPASLTTPPAIDVSCTLARMVEAGCSACVMEVSSHSLHQRRVAGPGGVAFRAGVFTNLSGDHLDYHKTMDAYAEAKAMLLASLPDAASGGVAVVNISDPAHSRMVRDCKARVLRCELDTPLAVRGGGNASDTLCTARIVGAGPAFTDVEFTGPWGKNHPCRVPLVGEFNVLNALQAVTTVHALFGGTGEDDFSFDIIAAALARCAPPPGRLEPVTPESAPLSVFVDYAHTDDALKNVLTTLRAALVKRSEKGRAGQLRCVFGCGGDRDRTKRPRMGRVAADLADQVVITSDNPRTEHPDAIIAEILAGVPADAHPRLTIEPDRERAIHLAINAAEPGDVVLIAGKGHETYQILPDPNKPPGQGTVTRHFDDREVARDALRARSLPIRGPSLAPVCQPADSGELDTTEIDLVDSQPGDSLPDAAPTDTHHAPP